MSDQTPSVTIDWLSYTLPWNAPRYRKYRPEVSFALIAEHASGVTDEWVSAAPLHGYKYAFSSFRKPNLRVMLSPKDSVMGIHVQWGGSALQGESLLDRLDYAIAAGGTITRLDIAVDIMAPWNIRKFYETALDGGAETQARKFSIVESTTGTTMYAGSRSSQKYLRIYDKQAQTGGARPWTRVEMECKGEFAGRIAKYIMQEGLHSIPQIIRGYIDFPSVAEWAVVMNSNEPAISSPAPQKWRNTRGWLLETVAPALAKYEQENPGFMAEFGGRMNMLLAID